MEVASGFGFEVYLEVDLVVDGQLVLIDGGTQLLGVAADDVTGQGGEVGGRLEEPQVVLVELERGQAELLLSLRTREGESTRAAVRGRVLAGGMRSECET